MSISAAQAEAFYSEIVQSGAVWTIQDANGFPATKGSDGRRAAPFWSKRSRAQKIVNTVPHYGDFKVLELDLGVWRDRWLPGLAADGIRVGINWSGDRATGYDLAPEDVETILQARG